MRIYKLEMAPLENYVGWGAVGIQGEVKKDEIEEMGDYLVIEEGSMPKMVTGEELLKELKGEKDENKKA